MQLALKESAAATLGGCHPHARSTHALVMSLRGRHWDAERSSVAARAFRVFARALLGGLARPVIPIHAQGTAVATASATVGGACVIVAGAPQIALALPAQGAAPAMGVASKPASAHATQDGTARRATSGAAHTIAMAMARASTAIASAGRAGMVPIAAPMLALQACLVRHVAGMGSAECRVTMRLPPAARACAILAGLERLAQTHHLHLHHLPLRLHLRHRRPHRLRLRLRPPRACRATNSLPSEARVIDAFRELCAHLGTLCAHSALSIV
mmetsp:Transcript_50783/g.132011  ORF Transcript_50783/g.132011 Transcript_50783/m.132011 type:complete len:271 (-) Transcript_50783:32-844(-)